MEILKWGILLVLVFPVPFLLGLIPVRYMDGLQKTPAMTYVCGWFVSFFVFELTAVPFILLEKSFTSLVITYSVIIGVLLVLSLWIGRTVWRELIGAWRKGRTLPFPAKLGWAMVFGLVVCEMAYAVLYEYYDGDDAYYIATAVLTRTFDSMYLRDAYSGYLCPLDLRHAFSPVPIYQAWLSQLSGVAPAEVAHTMLAPVWLLFLYCIYGQLANCILRDHRAYKPVFMIFIIVWFAFGNISIYTAETFAMTRTWQGKGLFAGMVLPALFLCLLYLAGEEASEGMWMLFVCVCLSGVFATSVSFMLVPTIAGVAAVLIGVKKRSFRYALKLFSCCVPCLILGGCYLLLSAGSV